MADRTGDQEKVDEYLRVIEERILGPIQNSQIKDSCTATLMLLFAGIDGLGKLKHPHKDAYPAKRIEHFLEFMAGEYANKKKQLVNLRNSLMHNAINIESYLSRTQTGSDKHLQKIGANGYIYVNTLQMTKDFESAFVNFKIRLKDDPELMIQVSSRLEWKDDDSSQELFNAETPMPSPPPPVQFIITTEKKSKYP